MTALNIANCNTLYYIIFLDGRLKSTGTIIVDIVACRVEMNRRAVV